MKPDPRDHSTGTRDPDTAPIKAVGTGERQRAAIALGILAIVALIVVGIMVAVLGNNSDNPTPKHGLAGPTGPAVQVTGGRHASQQPSGGRHQSSRSNGSHHSQQPSSRPSDAPVSCPTSAPCDLPDDVGNVVKALNAYRTAHGKPAVRGTVTQPARTCAVSSGNDCPNGFYWEPVGRSGQQVVSKIAAGGGESWLLDDRMSAVQVGWAYLPSSHSFECAVVSNAP